jgi:hypothetical protein
MTFQVDSVTIAPVGLELLLEAFYSPNPVTPKHTRAHIGWADELVRRELCTYSRGRTEDTSGLVITPLGRAHVKQLTALPVPRKRTVYVSPDGKVIEGVYP